MLNNIVKLSIVTSLALSLNASPLIDNKALKTTGINISHTNEYDEKKNFNITRVHNKSCKKVNGMDPNVIWGGDYALKTVPSDCKKTFVTTVGFISPIKIDGVETYGELEVIEFMKKAQKDSDMVFVDARMRDWFAKGTIPTAINLPFKSFNPKHQDFEIVMDTSGVEVNMDEKTYDFENAKTLLLFCNGIWCPQSLWAIENLISIGYPKDKLKWYRGGLYDWTSVNLTTTMKNK